MGLVTSEIAAQCCYGHADEKEIAEDQDYTLNSDQRYFSMTGSNGHSHGVNGGVFADDLNEEEYVEYGNDTEQYADPTSAAAIEAVNDIDFGSEQTVWPILDRLFASYHSAEEGVDAVKAVLLRNVDDFGQRALWQSVKNHIEHRSKFPFKLSERMRILDFTQKSGYKMDKMDALQFGLRFMPSLSALAAASFCSGRFTLYFEDGAFAEHL